MTTLVYNPIFSPFRLTFTFAFILLACQAGLEITEISETRPVEVFPITTGTPHFAIDLDYPQAFELKILSFNGNDTQTGFCETFPSQITSKVVWSGPVNATNDQVEEDDTGLGESYSYDNIEFFNGYYFILDSLTFRITAIKDITDPSTYIAIESEFENQEEDQQLEDTYLILDPDISYLYIVTRKNLLYYPLTDFFDAVESNQPIPTIIDEAPNYRGYDMILSIRYYKKRLYIVADNIVDVYFLSDDGQITPQIQFDAEFFGAEEVSIADIAFRGNYSFVLDQFKGVYVVDITNQDLPHNSNLTDKFKFQQDETTGTQKGQFLEIIGDSLHIVSSGTRNPYIFEYIIVGDPILERLDFNRKIELYQSVRDTYTDSNFFFMITGFFNMVTKHSIPGRYFSSAVQDYLMEYWPVFGAKALVSQAGNKTSTVAVLHEDSFTVIIFEETNPSISCNTAGVKEGYYSFKLEAVQRDCPAKRDNIQADWNTVCEINQEIQLLMIKDSTDIGNVQESKETALYVVVGIGLMTLLVVVFCCLFRKYKKQHDHLEQKIKFKKLENEESKTRGAAEADRKPTVDSEQEINPYTLNIQAELKKSEEKDRQKEVERQKRESPTKSPYKSPTKGAENERPPNAEIGDMKPLDMDEIYGTKGKPKDDSF